MCPEMGTRSTRMIPVQEPRHAITHAENRSRPGRFCLADGELPEVRQCRLARTPISFIVSRSESPL